MILSDFLKTQFSGERQLPKFHYHVTETIVSMVDERVSFTLRAKGVPFEVTSDGVLTSQYDTLNDLFLSLGKRVGSRMAVWAHVDHYKTQFTNKYSFRYEWLQKFTERYMRKFYDHDMFENDFYLTFVLKPGMNDTLDDCIKTMEGIQQSVLQVLSPYDCELLSMYEHNGHMFSEFYEFQAYLYNGFWERVPVTSSPLYRTIERTTHFHRYGVIESHFPDGNGQFMTLYDFKAMGEETKGLGGQMNAMLELPFPFILCFSLALINPSESLRQMNQALNKAESAGDEAEEQMDDIVDGKGAVSAGTVYFGEFHGAMIVFGASSEEAQARGHTADTTSMSQCSITFSRAEGSGPETFFSIFPGNFKRRVRLTPRTTRTFLGLFSMNTYSSGKSKGNPLGDGSAVIPLQTTVHGVYHFNFHYSMPEIDSRGEKRAGHTLILGATGAGKTTLQTALLCFANRFGARLFGVDKDGSMRGCIEALGGTYFRLAAGEPTGLNPFQLPDTPFNREFLYDLVKACGREQGKELSSEDSKDVKRAVDNVFELPYEHRRLGVVLQSIPDHGPNCLARRLADWCYGEDSHGRFAWALDNATNAFDWESFTSVGFDVSDFLTKNNPVTEPVLAYLFHLKTLMTRGGKGGLLATVVEEFWLPLKYPTTSEQILDTLKTGRRRDEFIVLVTQSPEDAIEDPLFPTILQQTPTKVFLPNPEAKFTTGTGENKKESYSLFLSFKEFEQLKKLGLQSRKFLVKQGIAQSAIAKLDLNGMGDDIAVLAMAAEDFVYLDQAKSAVGSHPDNWVPLYKQLRAEGRKSVKIN